MTLHLKKFNGHNENIRPLRLTFVMCITNTQDPAGSGQEIFCQNSRIWKKQATVSTTEHFDT